MNRTVSIKDKVRKRLPICGTHINIADSMVSELMGALGYDFLWVDMEHTYLSCQNVHNHLMAASASGTPVFVRVPVDDLTTRNDCCQLSASKGYSA